MYEDDTAVAVYELYREGNERIDVGARIDQIRSDNQIEITRQKTRRRLPACDQC